jgi:CDP-glycerol glycerophosphotransferase (TagB/SpsB family)
LNSDAQLLTALENLDALIAEYAPKYRAWQAKFDHAEDGQAAKRVVDIVWGEAK